MTPPNVQNASTASRQALIVQAESKDAKAIIGALLLLVDEIRGLRDEVDQWRNPDPQIGGG